MDRKNFKNSDLVEIIFDDPTEFDTNFDTCTDPIECRTIGWLDEINSSIVRVAWLLEKNGTPYVGLAIPRGCVKNILHLDSEKPLLSFWRKQK